MVGIYCSVIGIISLACNITWIMQIVRRSVEECFNAFVGLYFIFKSILTIVKIFTINEPSYTISINSTKSFPINYSKIPYRNQYLFTNRIPIGLASLVMAYSMYQICIGLNGVKRGRFFTRKDHEYLRDIPPSVMKTFEILQLGMIILMFAMNCITEFTGISWCSFLIPALLLVFAICRELALPRIAWFANHLDKLDPRHVIHIPNVCLSHELDNLLKSEKSSDVSNNKLVSANSGIQMSSVVSYQDSPSDIEDSVDTSGNEISSCTSSDQDS